MKHFFIMADGKVGSDLLSWCLSEYRDQLALVVVAAENALASMARDAGVTTHVFKDETTLCAELDQLKPIPHVGFLLWWPQIVRAPLLDRPNLTLLNTHPSLLPHNRGKHPNFWAIVEEVPFGVSLHQVNGQVDAGAIFSQAEIEYDWTDTGESLYYKGQNAMIALVKRALPATLSEDELPLVPQDPTSGSAHLARELEPAVELTSTATTKRGICSICYARGHSLAIRGARLRTTARHTKFQSRSEKNQMDVNRQFRNDCEEEIARMASDDDLHARTLDWISAANAHKYSYHFDWQGRPIIQYPQDIMAMQELIWQVRPDLIIETGIAHGGSLVFMASQLAQLDLCDVIEAGEVLDPASPKASHSGYRHRYPRP